MTNVVTSTAQFTAAGTFFPKNGEGTLQTVAAPRGTTAAATSIYTVDTVTDSGFNPTATGVAVGDYVFTTDGGFEVGFHGEYLEIVPDERLVATEVYEGAEAPAGVEAPVNTVAFSETGDGRTRMTLLTDCHTKELRDLIVDSGMEGGMQDQMDLLEELARSLR